MADADDDQFKRDVRYYYEEKGDPTRFTGWDAARCQQLMPSFYEAWRLSRIYENLARLAIKQEAPDDYL